MIPPDPSGSIVYEDSGLGFRVEFFGFRAGRCKIQHRVYSTVYILGPRTEPQWGLGCMLYISIFEPWVLRGIESELEVIQPPERGSPETASPLNVCV